MTKEIIEKMLTEVIEEVNRNARRSNADKRVLRHLLGIQYLFTTEQKKRVCDREQCNGAELHFWGIHEDKQHDQYIVFECSNCEEQYIIEQLEYDQETHKCHRIEE